MCTMITYEKKHQKHNPPVGKYYTLSEYDVITFPRTFACVNKPHLSIMAKEYMALMGTAIIEDMDHTTTE